VEQQVQLVDWALENKNLQKHTKDEALGATNGAPILFLF
jgi:hypothetical protein